MTQETRQINTLLDSILRDKPQKVAKLLVENPNLIKCDFHHGNTNPMCRTSYLGYRNIMAILIKAGGDVNKTSHMERTPLIWAAFRGNINMISMLLEHNADYTCVDTDGWNALDIAVVRMQYKAAKYLLEHTDL
jgi:ankyrin repeat protein